MTTDTFESFTSATGARIDFRPAPGFVVGGTSRGKSDAAGVAAIGTAYGATPPGLRLFNPGALPPNFIPGGGGLTVASFTSITTAGTVAAGGYTHVALDHEIDRKPIPTWASDMRKLQASGVTNLCAILTGGAFAKPGYSATLAQYILPGITHIGVDLDGVSFDDHYHDYSPEIAAVVAFCRSYGLTWGVTELNARRAVKVDPDGSRRAAWLTGTVRAVRDAGAQYALLWEQDEVAPAPNTYSFTTPAEVAAVRAMFALAR